MHILISVRSMRLDPVAPVVLHVTLYVQQFCLRRKFLDQHLVTVTFHGVLKPG